MDSDKTASGGRVVDPATDLSDDRAGEAPFASGLGAETSRHSPAIACPKCGAGKIAKSRTTGLDALTIRLLPRRPFRCLRCYHRFWSREAFFSDSRRSRSWLVLIASLAFLVFLTGDWSLGSLNAPPGGNVSNISNSRVAPNSSSTRSGGISETTDVRAPASPEQARELVASSEFDEPRRAIDLPVMGDIRTLTPEQTEVRIRLARESATRIREANETRAQVLTRLTESSPQEGRALLRVSINYQLEQWRQAWQKGDAEQYLSFYSSEFQPDENVSLASWRAQRLQRVRPERDIRVTLSDFSIEFADDNQSATVEFTQVYQSSTFEDTSVKQLNMINSADKWYIQSETSD